MRRLLLLCLFALPVMSGAVIGPSGALIDRAMKPLGGALRANVESAAAAGDPCGTGDAFLNYDARLVAGTDNVQETSWANAGSGGSSWDATDAVSGGLTYQQAGDCLNSPEPCLVVDVTGADMLQMPADVAHTWTASFFCMVASFPNTTSAFQRTFQVSADVAARNTGGSNGTYDQTYTSGNVATINTFPTPREDFLSVQCVDTTNSSSMNFAVAGFGTQTGIYNGYSSYRDIERVSLGGRFDAQFPCKDCEIHQFVAWDEDPGLSVLDMANCLSDEWS